MTTAIRVLYDDHGFRMKHGGVARYFCELFWHFQNVEVVLPFRETACYYLQQPPWSMMPPSHDYEAIVKRWFFGFHLFGVWTVFMFLTQHFPSVFKSTDNRNDRNFGDRVAKRDFDLVHLTEAHCYGEYWKSIPRNIPLVITVHDLIPELIWHREDIRSARSEVLKRASSIIAVSKFTKQKLIEQFAIPEEKITVVHHGYSRTIRMSSPVAEFLDIPYLLYVGKRDGYKRFDFFLRAVEPILHSRKDLHVVCTGDSFSKEEQRFLHDLGLSGRVHAHFATDNEMQWLYRNAKIFVYPSFMEGFGLPILEAFSEGCPIVLSDSSCFPEVAGDAALYFNPDSSDDLREKLVMVLDDERLAGTLRLKGKERLSQFSWEKCASETERVYRKTIESSNEVA